MNSAQKYEGTDAPTYTNRSFKTWKFGTVNIRSGKEKDEGGKIYEIAKTIVKSN